MGAACSAAHEGRTNTASYGAGILVTTATATALGAIAGACRGVTQEWTRARVLRRVVDVLVENVCERNNSLDSERERVRLTTASMRDSIVRGRVLAQWDAWSWSWSWSWSWRRGRFTRIGAGNFSHAS